jgi:cellulose synthase/poly-beta-1,6-N-acetylglucosamine synthase-like glycosyltransferase
MIDWSVLGVAVLALLAGFGHFVYPMLLYFFTRASRAQDPPEVEAWPSVSVVVSAYRESAVIEAKVSDVFANGYLGNLEVIVIADDPDTARVARNTSARVIESAARSGKAAALNVGMAQAAHEVVVFSDANTELKPGSIAALARWFEDPTVGAVAGEKYVGGAKGMSAYWRFESWIKKHESLTGTTIGFVGELGAARKSLCKSLPENVTLDDLWFALDVIEGGGRVVYEPEAVAYEPASPTWGDEWKRRRRVVTGTLDLLWRRRALLGPRHRNVAAQLWGHRLVRSSIGPVAHLTLLVVALINLSDSLIAQAFVVGHIVAGLALAGVLTGVVNTAPARLMAHVLFLQGAALGGVVGYTKGRRPVLWEKSERILEESPLQVLWDTSERVLEEVRLQDVPR